MNNKNKCDCGGGLYCFQFVHPFVHLSVLFSVDTFTYSITVKPILSGYSKIDKTKV